MKKFLCLLLAGCFMVLSVGCSEEKDPLDSIASDELESVKEEKSDSEKNEHEDDAFEKKEIYTENTNVYDKAGIFNDSQLDDLNSYCAWLAKTYKINVAVATTDNIGDNKPADYAKKIYNENYKGDGILFLLNNDTENDYFYRTGVPSEFITDGNVQMLLSEISPMLALEDYSAAAGYALEEAEECLPKYFTDRTGELKKDKISSMNEHIESNAGSININVYYVIGTGDDSIEDFAKKRFEMFYEKGEDAAMLVINGENGESYLNVSGSMEYLSESSEDIKKSVKSCYDKNDGMDIENAVKKFIGFVE